MKMKKNYQTNETKINDKKGKKHNIKFYEVTRT